MLRRHYIQGLSFIELLITLLIFLILASATPLFLKWLYLNNQTTTVADEIKMAIQFAKIEALSKAHTVTLAPLIDNMDWSNGIALCEDNPQHQCHKDANLIRVWHWHHKNIQISWTGFESKNYLRFTPDLMTRAANGHFIILDSSNNKVKLVVNRLGNCHVETLH